MRLVVAICGASGIAYAVELLKALREHEVETFVVVSDWGRKVMALETEYTPAQIEELATACFDESDMAAAIASSSFLLDGMIVIPATVKTVSKIAAASCDNLIVRAADNMLKMGGRLVVCIRETPLSAPTLDNLKKISLFGGIVMPLCPGFYHKPERLEDLYDFMVGKCLDVLGIENSRFKRWQ